MERSPIGLARRLLLLLAGAGCGRWEKRLASIRDRSRSVGGRRRRRSGGSLVRVALGGAQRRPHRRGGIVARRRWSGRRGRVAAGQQSRGLVGGGGGATKARCRPWSDWGKGPGMGREQEQGRKRDERIKFQGDVVVVAGSIIRAGVAWYVAEERRTTTQTAWGGVLRVGRRDPGRRPKYQMAGSATGGVRGRPG